ncbi:hypothetical protein EXS71_03960 [Candidatus Uhrbacteria bacterium]|nr:hypothetical protein [Candidatus Uhrbacteria bacterium]
MFDNLQVGEKFRLGFFPNQPPMLIRMACQECSEDLIYLSLQKGMHPSSIISAVLRFIFTLNQLLQGVGSSLEFKIAGVRGEDAEILMESIRRGYQGADLAQEARFDAIDLLVVDRTKTN